MMSFLLQHQFWTAVGIYWVFSAAVSSMPEPGAEDSALYLWLFRFLHTTAGNLTTALSNRFPGLKTVILPKENQRDLEEIPAHVQRDLKFRFVETMDEVLSIALHDRPKGEARPPRRAAAEREAAHVPQPPTPAL